MGKDSYSFMWQKVRHRLQRGWEDLTVGKGIILQDEDFSLITKTHRSQIWWHATALSSEDMEMDRSLKLLVRCSSQFSYARKFYKNVIS